MANLSQDDRTIIAKHPLANSLDHLREPLRKVYESRFLSHDGAVNSFDKGSQEATSKLLDVLGSFDAVFYLLSKTQNRDITFEFATLRRRVRNSDFKYEHYRALSRFVIKRAFDVDI